MYGSFIGSVDGEKRAQSVVVIWIKKSELMQGIKEKNESVQHFKYKYLEYEDV